MSNEDLAARVKNHIDEADNMLLLWQQNTGLIATIAKKYSAYEDMEDLMQEGYIGLCKAVEAYDPAKGASFATYAVFWIRQQMLRHIEDNGACVRVPAHMQNKCRKLQKLENEFAKYYGRKPTDREISLVLGIPIKQVDEVKNSMEWGNMESLDICIGDGGGATIGDIVLDGVCLEEQVLNQIGQEELKKALWEWVDGLPGEMSKVVRMQYQGNMTLKEISRETGIGYKAAIALRNKAIRSLRYSPEARGFMPEQICAAAYRPVGSRTFQRTWTSSTEGAALDLMQLSEGKRWR